MISEKHKRNRIAAVLTAAATLITALIVLLMPTLQGQCAYAEITTSGAADDLDQDSYTGTKVYDGQPFRVPTAEELSADESTYNTYVFVWYSQNDEPLSAAPTDVGTYKLVISTSSGTSGNGNYINGITITPAPLTVTAENKTAKVEESLPQLTYTADGLVEGETLDGIITLECSAPVDGNGRLTTAGGYEITISLPESGAVSDNYSVTAVKGTLEVTEKSAFDFGGITRLDGVYSGAAHLGYDAGALNTLFEQSGIAEGEYSVEYYSIAEDGTEASMQAAPISAGKYKVKITVAEAADRRESELALEFEIAPKPLTVTAENKTAKIGESLPQLTYTADGLVEGETLDGIITLECSAPVDGNGRLTTAGGYEIIVPEGEYASADYTVTRVNGTLTVTAAREPSSPSQSSPSPSYRPRRESVDVDYPTTELSEGWYEIMLEIRNLTKGAELTVDLNTVTTAPRIVIEAIKEVGVTVTFRINSTYSWVLNGAEITEPASAELTFESLGRLAQTNALAGDFGTAFRIDNTNIPTGLEVRFKYRHAGRYANLYRIDAASGAAIPISGAVISADGTVTLPNVYAEGSYVVMLDEIPVTLRDFNNDGRLDEGDIQILLEFIVGLSDISDGKETDVNLDGLVNAKDAAGLFGLIG